MTTMQNGIMGPPEDAVLVNQIETQISFKSFITYLEGCIKSESTIKIKFYEYVINAFNKFEASGAIISMDNINDFEQLFELIYCVLAPVTADQKRYVWAMGNPVAKTCFYGTDAYCHFVENFRVSQLKIDNIVLTDDHFKTKHLEFLYRLIVKKYYGVDFINSERIFYFHPDTGSELMKYYRLMPDTRFVDIIAKSDLPEINFKGRSEIINEGNMTAILCELLPLSLFRMEGFIVVTLEDVTYDYALEEIKYALTLHDQNQHEIYDTVIRSLKMISGNSAIELGLLPLIKLNNKLVIDESEGQNSLLPRATLTYRLADDLFHEMASQYLKKPVTQIFQSLTKEEAGYTSFTAALKEAGIKSYAMIPVFHNKEVAGILEVYSSAEELSYEMVLPRFNASMPLLAQLLQDNITKFNLRIENIIREKFTLLQPSVQWKFNEAAWEYLRISGDGEKKVETATVTFDDIYPLFGAVDVRNSTVERNRALGLDMGNVLLLIASTVENISKILPVYVVNNFKQTTEGWGRKINEFLKLGDFVMLKTFFQREVVGCLNELMEVYPDASEELSKLRDIILLDNDIISKERKSLETSMQLINNSLNEYYKKEYSKLQAIYPCYFDAFRTDGVEYDVYVGGAIAPQLEFTREHLREFRRWQLKSMCGVVKLTNGLLNQMSKPLQTTQLIYINPHTITITFRNDERRFDVEGAYNIRYQVIKKRIDKANIKNTRERLTQPGKIALVYFDDEDGGEYLGFIKDCVIEGILEENHEMLELEELQGVAGLKAIRVTVKT